MGKEFLLLMTLASELSLLLSAVLDTVNLIFIAVFSFVLVQIEYKNTKSLVQMQKYLEKIALFTIIFRNFAI
jgi:hypothetical protein